MKPNPDPQDQRKTSVVDRDEILTWLKKDICQLRKWARQSHTIKSSIRVYCLRSSIHGCSVMLQALKDRELEDMMKEIDGIKKHIGMG